VNGIFINIENIILKFLKQKKKKKIKIKPI